MFHSPGPVSIRKNVSFCFVNCKTKETVGKSTSFGTCGKLIFFRCCKIVLLTWSNGGNRIRAESGNFDMHCVNTISVVSWVFFAPSAISSKGGKWRFQVPNYAWCCWGAEKVLRRWEGAEVLGVPNLHFPPWSGESWELHDIHGPQVQNWYQMDAATLSSLLRSLLGNLILAVRVSS